MSPQLDNAWKSTVHPPYDLIQQKINLQSLPFPPIFTRHKLIRADGGRHLLGGMHPTIKLLNR